MAMTIKMKLGILLATAIGFLLLLTFLLWNTARTLSDLQHISALSSEVEIYVLKLRKSEKDFLMRSDLKYEAEYFKTFDALAKNNDDLEKSMAGMGMSTDKISGLRQELASYGKAFREVVNISKTVGLTPNDGLQGGLRQAVHEAEKTMEAGKNGVLLKDMLMLRRHEKDFLLRLDLKYVEQFNGHLKSFMASVQGTDIAPKMEQYGKNFLALVEGHKKWD
ncbi:MAG: hypothetical protein WC073_14270 [Sterolibacterium sp.]